MPGSLPLVGPAAQLGSRTLQGASLGSTAAAGSTFPTRKESRITSSHELLWGSPVCCLWPSFLAVSCLPVMSPSAALPVECGPRLSKPHHLTWQLNQPGFPNLIQFSMRICSSKAHPANSGPGLPLVRGGDLESGAASLVGAQVVSSPHPL